MSFRDWKGEHFIPQGVHKSIWWSKSDPYIEDGIIEIDHTNLLKEREQRKKWRQKLSLAQSADDVSSKVSDNGNKLLASPSDDHQYINVQLCG